MQRIAFNFIESNDDRTRNGIGKIYNIPTIIPSQKNYLPADLIYNSQPEPLLQNTE